MRLNVGAHTKHGPNCPNGLNEKHIDSTHSTLQSEVFPNDLGVKSVVLSVVCSMLALYAFKESNRLH